MPVYECRIARADGTLLQERVEAADDQAARQRLEERGDLVFSVQPLWRFSWPTVLGRRLRSTDFLVFNQELLILIRTGMPIMRILDVLMARISHPRFQAALEGIKSRVRGGASLSDAMGEYPAYFTELYVSSVRAGERSGDLTGVLERYSSYLKRVLSVRKKVLSALTYPMFLMVVGMAIVLFLLTYVMPTFIQIFQDSRTQLPTATQRLIVLVHWIQSYYLYVVGGLILAVALARWSYQTVPGRRWMDARITSLPLFGAIMGRHLMIIMSRTLATSLAGGTTLVGSLVVASDALNNRAWSRELLNIRLRVEEGQSLSAAFDQAQLLPKMSVEMISVGESSGSLTEMLIQVAEFHEDELDRYLNRVTTWAEPVMLMIMGVVIAAIIISMYLPIFHLAGTIG